MALSTIGTNSIADNAVTLAKATGFGKILQIVHGSTVTQVTETSGSQVDTGLTASITPSSTSSKVFISLTQTFGKNANDTQIDAYLYRDSTTIVSEWLNDDIRTGSALNLYPGTSSLVWLDSPSSTSSVAYKTRFRNANASGTVYTQPNNGRSSIILMEVGA
tara:strand:+ start:130 stop:615 length:486 start_codon:yes stop_codon:yes gene_type:complete